MRYAARGRRSLTAPLTGQNSQPFVQQHKHPASSRNAVVNVRYAPPNNGQPTVVRVPHHQRKKCDYHNFYAASFGLSCLTLVSLAIGYVLNDDEAFAESPALITAAASAGSALVCWGMGAAVQKNREDFSACA